MKEKGFAVNIVIIIVLVVIVFLSQQPYFRKYGENFYLQAKTQVMSYWAQATDWFMNNVYSRVSGGVEQKKAEIQEEVAKQKNNIVQNVWEKIKNYFADIFSKTTGTTVQ